MTGFRDIRARVTPDDLVGDLIGEGDPLFGVVWVNPDRMGGIPCFFGTRIPVATLFQHLEHEGGLEEFRRGFSDVSPAMVADVLRLASERLLSPFGRAA